MGVAGSFFPAGNVADYPVMPENGRGTDGIDASAIGEAVEQNKPVSQWPGPVRALYRGEADARLYREHHFLFMLGFITCLATIGIDALIEPAMAKEGAILRILIVGPVTLFAMFAAQKGWTRIVSACVILAPVAFAGIVTHLTFHLPPQFAATYLTATTLIIGLANIVLPLSMRGLLAFNLTFIAAVLTVLALGPNGTLIDRADYLLLLTVVACGTLPLAARIEQLRRRNFLLNLRSRLSARELREANRKLRDLSERDPLTGTLNRRGFARVFDEQMAAASADQSDKSRAAKGRVALIMVDIDHFKHFNDTHGHQAGDTCLAMVAKAVQAIIEQADGVVSRFGGEEFIAAFREDYPGSAAHIAEEIRGSVARLLVPVGGEHGPAARSLVTASIGVGLGEKLSEAISPGACEALRADLIEMADTALYQAKRAGRNKVEVVSSGAQPALSA